MRSIALLTLMSILALAPAVMAQEEAEDAEDAQDDTPTRVVPADVASSGFVPSEEVEADTAVAFPTDI